MQNNARIHHCVMNHTVTSMHFVWANRFTRLLHVFSLHSFVHDRRGHQHQTCRNKNYNCERVTFLSNFYKTTEWQVCVSHFESSHDFHSVSFHTWNRIEKCSNIEARPLFTVRREKQGCCTICQSRKVFSFTAALICFRFAACLSILLYKSFSKNLKFIANLLFPNLLFPLKKKKKKKCSQRDKKFIHMDMTFRGPCIVIIMKANEMH
jgi:hypothetical protein